MFSFLVYVMFSFLVYVMFSFLVYIKNIIDTVGKDDGLSKYHVTLGYIYKPITHEDKILIDNEVKTLNLLL
jgi:hypothetical protein